MMRRSTFQPLRAARRATVREHIAAALGVCAGMLATALFVIALHVS